MSEKHEADTIHNTASMFTPFKKLPVELRRKIWKLAANTGRLIEIGKALPGLNHYEITTVLPRSRQPPAILQACKESRDEGMGTYLMINLEQFVPNRAAEPWKGWIYYNPNADILYFGEKSCLTSMQKACCDSGLEIPRVATDIRMWSNRCCNVYFDLLFGRSKVECVANILHGHQGLNIPGVKWDGCKGLKEVFFVDEPSFLGWEVESVDENVGIQPGLGPGSFYTHGFYNAKNNDLAVRKLGKRIKAGPVLTTTGKNMWRGDNRPTFHFVRLAFHPSSSQKCEFLFLKLAANAQYQRIYNKTIGFTKSIGSKAIIRFDQERFVGEGDYGIKIVGLREEVEQIKGEIVRMCRLKRRVGGEIMIVERAEASAPVTGKP